MTKATIAKPDFIERRTKDLVAALNGLTFSEGTNEEYVGRITPVIRGELERFARMAEVEVDEARAGRAAILAMMRQQRDDFRRPGGMGNIHPQQTRELMAALLDWYLLIYDKEIA